MTGCSQEKFVGGIGFCALKMFATGFSPKITSKNDFVG
jgi:hypothetical protein